ncbi:MAG TPA: calcium-translocating P-type ATPase, SERCA-type [Methanocella sp.]|uniref:calcium-translocating P-type ATPase, SERCA-type n=1 Tax=Methanocella sp. TaxID=2052833 RepID=UPI002C9E545A|nr:calcium-translocating P-type ATPase, SERCA-type [Methanocella sp.]HTY92162.1 calcium-translocating P-type ATPase, SERCA-type [Methanocella sp.]
MHGIPWHALKLKDIYARLKTDKKGLKPEEAAKRLEKYGRNALKAGKKASVIVIFLSQFNNFLIYLLIAAATVSFLIGERLDAAIIALIVVLNAILGFAQEYKAEQSIESLRSLVVQEAFVVRGGHRLKVPASDLVPGDIIEVEAGENVPADCRLIYEASLKVDEAALTGESEPAKKSIEALPEDTALGDMDNMLFMGTSVLDGRGMAVVTATGMDTEIGRITSLVESGAEQSTPMQASIDRLGRLFGISAVAICSIILAAGLLEGQKLYDMFLIAVSLAVAAIPEGLPATITIVLALGVQRMAKKKAVVRRLSAIETLGSTSVICTDKTGTLTQNVIVVRKIATAGQEYEVTGSGYSPDGEFVSRGGTAEPASDRALKMLLTAGALCNNAIYERLEDQWNIVGDSTEVALLVAAAKAGYSKILMEDDCPRIFEVPFNTETRRMTTVNACKGKKYVFAKGAPEVVLTSSSSILIGGRVMPADAAGRDYFMKTNDDMAADGMRVLGLAYREIVSDPAKMSIGELEGDLTFLGLAGMMDPPRPEVKDSVEKCKSAGIDVVMITGDQRPTAVAIARQLGIFREGDGIISGTELSEASEEKLDSDIGRIKVYARTSPEQKLRIVAALRRRGHVVAMTGDGVNDAPALKQADIGVSMGITGTDVSRQASDIVLTDDNFATIVAAVEEGRKIYDNVKNVVKYLFASNMGEVLVVLLGIMLGLPLPLLAIQILWVNLVTDSLPALALSVDPVAPGVMKRPPRPRAEGLFTRLTLFDMALIGIATGVGTLGLFHLYLPRGLDMARTVAFTALVIFQMWNCLNCRSEDRSLFKVGIFSNPYILGAIAVSILLQSALLYVPFLEDVFKTSPLSAYDWLIIAGVSSSTLILVEARKFISSKLRERR